MKAYLELLNNIIENGDLHEDRTGVGRVSIFGTQMRFNLKEGFPLVTTRKIFTRGMIEEMLWFIKGDTNVTSLTDKGVNIWNNWALREEHITKRKEQFISENSISESFEDGVLLNIDKMVSNRINTIGPMYGYVWRNSINGIDQLSDLITNLKERPYSARHIVTAWIPEYIPNEKLSPQDNVIIGKGALAPCHMMFQCFVKESKDTGKLELSLLMYQR